MAGPGVEPRPGRPTARAADPARAERAGREPVPSPRDERVARTITAVHAAAAVYTVFVLLFSIGRRHRPSLIEVGFGVLNVPAGDSVVAFAILALLSWNLLGRKRIAWLGVIAFQAFGVYLGLAAVLRLTSAVAARFPWASRGEFGVVLDLVSAAVGIVLLVVLWRVRDAFPARVRRGSARAAVLVGLTGVAVTGAVAAAVVALASRGDVGRRYLHVVMLALGDTDAGDRVLGTADHVAARLGSLLLGVTIVLSVVAFVRSARAEGAWTPEHELGIRRLLAEHGDRDSLGYFATRRDKLATFAPDGRAVVTYTVLGGVSLASADPVGRPESWAAAIAAWKREARLYGWQPAVLSASEEGARAYAAQGFSVIPMGDEAILHPERFDLGAPDLAPVRHAVQRATRAGLVVTARRQAELSAQERREVAARAHEWRGDEPERGFSMALGRGDDAADARTLVVTARDEAGALAGLLSFVPWGRAGVSLDLMRRSPSAPNGVTELMVSHLLTHADEVDVRRVSLNFCMFRSVYAGAESIGRGPLVRTTYSVLGVLDRFWQLERLYRANEKYRPVWVPRYLCVDDRVGLVQVALAAGAAEGFLPRIPAPPGADAVLPPAAVAEVEAIDARAGSVEARGGPRRSDQTRHRIARVAALDGAGTEAYPAGDPVSSLPLADVAARVGAVDALAPSESPAPPQAPAAPAGAPGIPPAGDLLTTTARVRDIRDHGGVVFADLVDAGRRLQVRLDASRCGRDLLDRFTRDVGCGDLVRVTGRPSASRTGSPVLDVTAFTLLAVALHPIPFRGLTDPRARARRRTVDLVVNPAQVEVLRARSAVVRGLRSVLDAEGYLEVETPILQAVHGGASARPFRTHINAYGTDLSLRIAPELYLKRLLVGGVGPVYELGRSFRNEGADATHNPEFTSLEAYLPGGDYTSMRHLAERLVRAAAVAVHGREVVPAPARERVRDGLDGVELLDVSGEWPVIPVLDAVSDAVGVRVSLESPLDTLRELARAHDVPVRPHHGPGAVIEELYAGLVEPHAVRPTFFVDFPVETSPLTRPHRLAPGLVERWDLVICGMEVGTAYSELTDPLEQRRRLTEQSLRAAAGDAEAMEVDEDFLAALELGMPPSGGLGMGVDRLAMLLTNTPIRSVLTFPFVRPVS